MADSDSYDSSTSCDSCYDSSPRRRGRSSNKPRNIFKNDGSFLKMFQRLQQEGKSETDNNTAEQSLPTESSPPISATSPPSSPPPPQTSSRVSTQSKDPTKKKSLMSFVGKRRGGKVLPTGVVKKQRKDDPVKEGNPKDAWSQYMEEVRKYKELSCEEEGKTRPLVK